MGIRIHEAKKKFNLNSKQMNEVLSNIGYTGSTNALAGLSDDIVAKIEKHLATKNAPAEKPDHYCRKIRVQCILSRPAETFEKQRKTI